MSRQRATAKVPAVETLERVVATGEVGELDIDLSILAVAEQADVDDFAILIGTLAAEVIFQVFDPVRIGFPV